MPSFSAFSDIVETIFTSDDFAITDDIITLKKGIKLPQHGMTSLLYNLQGISLTVKEDSIGRRTLEMKLKTTAKSAPNGTVNVDFELFNKSVVDKGRIVFEGAIDKDVEYAKTFKFLIGDPRKYLKKIRLVAQGFKAPPA